MENDEPIEGSMPEPFESEKPKSGIKRELDPNLPQSRRAFVGEWQDKIMRAKKHWEHAHKTMEDDMNFFMGKQWPWQKDNDDRYVANLVQRHIQQRVASLYAKNPKFYAKRRQTMDFMIWDGTPGQLQASQIANEISVKQTGMPDPQAAAIMQDVMTGMQRRETLDKIAKTLEIVFQYIVETTDFKTSMKQLVRRACVTGVGFVKIGYNRDVGYRPEDIEKINNIKDQLALLQRLMADKHDDKFDENSQRHDQLNILLHELSENQDFILDEGLVFDFPQSQNIIIDTRCRQLKGFVGAEWIAQEYVLTLNEIKELYAIDLQSNYVRQEDAVKGGDLKGKLDDMCKVWEIYSKKDGMKYVIADGYPEFLTEPNVPEINIKRFWPFFVLTFNEVENSKYIYPPSDVRLLTPVQKEYNLARQRLREHRNANRPLYAIPTGALDESDVRKLIDRAPNEVVQLRSLQPGQKVNDLIQPVGCIPIDPALYDTTMLMEDLYRIVGSQEANMGGTGTSTATEVSVAESSRMSSLGSNIDDLDELLIEMSRAAGATLLTMMDPQTAQKIAGPGAIWPTLSAKDAAENLLLEVEAGSSGRPNKAADIANFERLAPTLLQIPGIDPTWLAKEAIKRMDDGLVLSEAVRAALPSIVAMNAMKNVDQLNSEGKGGANNQEQPAQAAPGSPAGSNTSMPGNPQQGM